MSPVRLSALLAMAAVLAHPSALYAQSAGPSTASKRDLLIVSQPRNATKKGRFVDIAYYIARSLQSGSEYHPLVFRADLPEIKAAILANSLTQVDIATPLAPEAARRVARGLHCDLLLMVSADATPAGVTAQARLEKMAGQSSYTTLAAQEFTPDRSHNAKSSLLAEIFQQVDAITRVLTGKTGVIDVTEPVSVKLGTPGVKRGKGTPDTIVRSPLVARTVPPEAVQAQPRPTAQVPARLPGDRGVSTAEVLVQKYRQSGDLANLIESLRELINERPRDAKLRTDLAQAYTLSGWDTAARDELQAGLALSPNSMPLHKYMADSLLKTGDFAGAITEYSAAGILAPKDAELRIGLADAELGSGDSQSAAKDYAMAAQLDPRNAAAHRKLGELLLRQGDYVQCAAEMTRAAHLVTVESARDVARDYSVVFKTVDDQLRIEIRALQAIRQGVIAGTLKREKAHDSTQDLGKQSTALSEFLDGLQIPPQLSRIGALYSQAAGLIAQSAEAQMHFFETQETGSDDESTLNEVEASKQLTAAAAGLKAILTPSSTAPE